MEDQTFWQEYDKVIGAAITLAITFAIAYIVDRFVLAHAGRVADRVSEAGVSRAAKTRLRVVRRLVFVVIVLIGVFLALNEFTKLDKLATGLLASSAVLGIVLGLAARQVLANPLAGMLLAFTQPIRIGDTITIDDEHGPGRRPHALLHVHRPGRRAPDDHPERARGDLDGVQPLDRRSPGAAPPPRFGCRPAPTSQAARSALAPLEATGIEVAEMTPEGVKVVVHGPGGRDRTAVGGEEAALRERAHQLLLEAGVLARDDAE